MHPRLCIGLCCGIVCGCLPASAESHELHGYVTFGSDYVFRGVSQSEEDPTMQGGIDYVHSSGLFAGVFAARVDFPERAFREDVRDTELDFYVGYGRAAGDAWAWDVAVLSYNYPDSGAFDHDYEELGVNLHYRDRARFGATISDDALAGRATGWSAELELRHPLGTHLQLSGTLGHYALANAFWRDYLYWDFGISTIVGPLTFDLRYFDAGSEAAAIAGADLADARLVASLSIGW